MDTRKQALPHPLSYSSWLSLTTAFLFLFLAMDIRNVSLWPAYLRLYTYQCTHKHTMFTVQQFTTCWTMPNFIGSQQSWKKSYLNNARHVQMTLILLCFVVILLICDVLFMYACIQIIFYDLSVTICSLIRSIHFFIYHTCLGCMRLRI